MPADDALPLDIRGAERATTDDFRGAPIVGCRAEAERLREALTILAEAHQDIAKGAGLPDDISAKALVQARQGSRCLATLTDPLPVSDDVRVRDNEIQPYDSDHTALVHVLWSAQRQGLTISDPDALASHIMRSKWMHAVRVHAVKDKP